MYSAVVLGVTSTGLGVMLLWLAYRGAGDVALGGLVLALGLLSFILGILGLRTPRSRR